MSSTLTHRQLVGAGAAGAALLATGAVPARAARRRNMDGAVRARQRAAREVIAAQRR